MGRHVRHAQAGPGSPDGGVRRLHGVRRLPTSAGAISGDEIQLETLDALKPATIRPTESSDYLYLL